VNQATRKKLSKAMKAHHAQRRAAKTASAGEQVSVPVAYDVRPQRQRVAPAVKREAPDIDTVVRIVIAVMKAL
jgi:allophanate hydrolase subunit 1